MQIDNAAVANAVRERLAAQAASGDLTPQAFTVDGTESFTFPAEHRFCYPDGMPPTFTEERHRLLFRPRYRAPGYPDSLIWDVQLLPWQPHECGEPSGDTSAAMTQRPHDQPPLPTEEIIRRLRAKPYSRLNREAADRLEEMMRRERDESARG